METEEIKEKSNNYTGYIVIGIIALIMFITNPSLEDHRSELILSLSKELQAGFYQSNLDQTVDLKSFKSVMHDALDREIKKNLSVNNFLFWSTSEYYMTTGQALTVSYGLFGFVFITKTFDEIKPAVVQE